MELLRSTSQIRKGSPTPLLNWMQQCARPAVWADQRRVARNFGAREFNGGHATHCCRSYLVGPMSAVQRERSFNTLFGCDKADVLIERR